jgi:hypothetical protein
MFRAAPRLIARSALPRTTLPARRYASTAPAQTSRSWKSLAARLGIAGTLIYYYNTTDVFAEEPPRMLPHQLPSIPTHTPQNALPSPQPTPNPNPNPCPHSTRLPLSASDAKKNKPASTHNSSNQRNNKNPQKAASKASNPKPTNKAPSTPKQAKSTGTVRAWGAWRRARVAISSKQRLVVLCIRLRSPRAWIAWINSSTFILFVHCAKEKSGKLEICG